ncbi:hypothetical protein J0818_28640 [Bacillus cereus]|uniref:Uncharacterized protein n=1 Tax=Bacillus mobilis TaxID=2026190 RepID=A0A1Y5Z5K3_9BACI|nr:MULTISPECIES: hypothetical protein [Bacillus cereus group]MBL3741138.1 hypothetical protein [Bacillus cereus]MBL3863836.1 hypothetical protein [Bacillus cereus]SMD78109.1 hypothetical protein BACERE00185_00993 [Bacillus mobilis]
MSFKFLGMWVPQTGVTPEWLEKLEICDESIFKKLGLSREKVIEICQHLHDNNILI